MTKNGIKRRERVQLLLSKEEKRALEAYAALTGESVTAALRALCRQHVDGFVGKPLPLSKEARRG